MPGSKTVQTKSAAKAMATRRARKELKRERAVTTALELSRREGIAGLTMRRLGEQLEVDPAVLYRLFRDKDELLLAVYDQVTAMTLDEIGDLDGRTSWQDALRIIATAIHRAKDRYPAVASLTFARTTGGPAERQMVELVLSTVARAGLPPEQTVLHYRAFIDTVLALCGQTAAIATLDPEVREKDAASWSRIYAKLPEQQYPTAHTYITQLINVEDDDIFRTTIEAIIAATEHAARKRGATGSTSAHNLHEATRPRVHSGL